MIVSPTVKYILFYKKIFIRILFLLSIGPFFSFTQNTSKFTNKIDSLNALLLTLAEDTNKAKVLNELAKEYIYTNPDTAFIIAQKEYEIAREINDKKYMSYSLNVQGVSFQIKGEYNSALKYYHKSLSMSEGLADKKHKGRILNNIGIIYWNLGDYPNALKYYHKSLSISENLGDKMSMANTYNNIGVIYKDQHDYPNALKNYFKSLSISEEHKNKNVMKDTYLNIGAIYYFQGDFPNALKNYNKSLSIAEELQDKNMLSNIFGNIGVIYFDQGIYSNALHYYYKSILLKRELGDKNGLAGTYINLGSLHKLMGNLDTSARYLYKGLEIAKEIDALPLQKDLYVGLTNLYENYATMEAGNNLDGQKKRANYYKMAYEYHQLYTKTKDSIFNEEKSKDIGKLEAKQEFEIAEMERKRTEDEERKQLAVSVNRRNNLQFSGIGIGILLLFTAVFFLGKFSLPDWLLELFVFIPFLLFFEFIIVFLDPYMETLTHGEPGYKLLVNAILAGCIFPIQQFFEGKLKRRLYKSNKINVEINKPDSSHNYPLKTLIFFILWLPVVLFFSFTQNNSNRDIKLDSLKKVLLTLKMDTSKAKVLNELGDKKGLAYSYQNLGTFYTLIGSLDSSHFYLNKALEIAKEINSLPVETESYKGLTELYDKYATSVRLNNIHEQTNKANYYKMAYEFHKLYTQSKDSLFNEEKSKEIGKLEAKHELEITEIKRKRMEDIERKQLAMAVNRRDNLQFSGIGIGLLLLFAGVFFLGKFSLPDWLLELCVFIPFLLFFEFVIVFLDPYMETLTLGEPRYKLFVNAILAGGIFPIQQFFERKLKKRLYKSKEIKC